MRCLAKVPGFVLCGLPLSHSSLGEGRLLDPEWAHMPIGIWNWNTEELSHGAVGNVVARLCSLGD